MWNVSNSSPVLQKVDGRGAHGDPADSAIPKPLQVRETASQGRASALKPPEAAAPLVWDRTPEQLVRTLRSSAAEVAQSVAKLDKGVKEEAFVKRLKTTLGDCIGLIDKLHYQLVSLQRAKHFDNAVVDAMTTSAATQCEAVLERLTWLQQGLAAALGDARRQDDRTEIGEAMLRLAKPLVACLLILMALTAVSYFCVDAGISPGGLAAILGGEVGVAALGMAGAAAVKSMAQKNTPDTMGRFVDKQSPAAIQAVKALKCCLEETLSGPRAAAAEGEEPKVMATGGGKQALEDRFDEFDQFPNADLQAKRQLLALELLAAAPDDERSVKVGRWLLENADSGRELIPATFFIAHGKTLLHEYVAARDSDMIKRLVTAVNGSGCSEDEQKAILNVSGLDLSDLDLSNATMRNVDFSGARLNGVSFKRARLTFCEFVNARLTKVDFTSAKMTLVFFDRAVLTDVEFNGLTQFDVADFSSASLVCSWPELAKTVQFFIPPPQDWRVRLGFSTDAVPTSQELEAAYRAEAQKCIHLKGSSPIVLPLLEYLRKAAERELGLVGQATTPAGSAA